MEEIERSLPFFRYWIEEAPFGYREVGWKVRYSRHQAQANVRGVNMSVRVLVRDLNCTQAMVRRKLSYAHIRSVRQVDGGVDVAFVELAPAEVLIAESDGIGCASPVGVFISCNNHTCGNAD